MIKELILSRLATADHIYGYMYGQPYIYTGETYRPDKIIKIKTSDLIIGKNSLVYVWGYPGSDANIYYFSDYGITWAFNDNKIKYITLEEWKNRRSNMNHQEALADYLKFKQKVMPTIDEDSILISSYFTEEEKYRIKEVFQDYYHMDIKTLAEHNKTLDTLFKKLGIIQEPYIINTNVGKALVLASNDLYYKVRMLDWTEEDIKQMGGLDEAWVALSKDQIIRG